jgi:hypothetical protein
MNARRSHLHIRRQRGRPTLVQIAAKQLLQHQLGLLVVGDIAGGLQVAQAARKPIWLDTNAKRVQLLLQSVHVARMLWEGSPQQGVAPSRQYQ